MVQMPNSVNPKLYEHGNTELNSQKCDKRVQTIEHLTQWVKDIVGTCGKPYEVSRNEILAHYMSGNRLRRYRHDLLPGQVTALLFSNG